MARFASAPLGAVLSLFFLTPAAWAVGDLRGFVRFGGDFGGDKVLEFQYDDGSTPDVPAGAGLLLTAGGVLAVYEQSGHAVDLQAALGLKYRTIPPAINQEAEWTRYPVEALLLYRAPFGLRVGGGVAFHLGNVLEASGGLINAKVEFESNPGFILQAEYLFQKWAVDLRYTLMEYTISSGGSGTVDANSFGFGFTFFFGGSKTPSS